MRSFPNLISSYDTLGPDPLPVKARVRPTRGIPLLTSTSRDQFRVYIYAHGVQSCCIVASGRRASSADTGSGTGQPSASMYLINPSVFGNCNSCIF